MAKLYRFEICVRTPAGGTGKTLETRYTDRSLEDYLIDTFQTDIVLGKNPYTEGLNDPARF